MIEQRDFKEELGNDFQEQRNHIDSVLKYWLEVEQFDLPEWHIMYLFY